MAYRRMSASGGGVEPPAPSFLDEFLEQIQPLPSQVKAKFAELRDLDDRASTLMSDAERSAADAVRKAATKSTGGNDPLKRAFQDVLTCQGKAVDCASRKVELAEHSYQLIEDTIKSLDDKLREYEAQLKKEGRWPAENNARKEGSGNRKSSSGAGASASGSGTGAATKAAGASAGSGANASTTPALGVSTGNPKSRRRDRERQEKALKQQLRAERKEAAAAAARAAKEEAQLASNAPDLTVVEDGKIDPNEPRYCYCNQVSYGEMVGCEGKNCAYEWFHFQCVGLTETPEGRWFCPDCKTKKKKKSS